jgi:hypothetical protein
VHSLLHRPVFRAASLALAAVFILLTPAMAQLRITGVISGTVRDPSGAAIAGAKVVLKDHSTSLMRETATGAAGTFVFPDLSHGSFELTVSAPGFSSAVVKAIQIAASQTSDVSIRLEIGQQTQTVTVEGTAPVLETVSQLVNTTQARETITQLPVLNRSNVLALARLAPGASPPGGGSTRYNNLPGGAVNVTVDGINNASNGFKSGGTVFYATVPVRLGAVDEVSVETGGLGACFMSLAASSSTPTPGSATPTPPPATACTSASTITAATWAGAWCPLAA